MKRLFVLCAALLLPLLAQAAPTCVVASASAPPTATLSFTAPTLNTDGTPVATPLTYQLWQGTASGAETQKAAGLTGSPIAINTGLTSNSTVYFYVVTVDANGTASVPSNEVCKTFPKAVPGTVVITIT
jgi:hypothetical protein